MSFLERTIERLSPGWARRRMEDRQELAATRAAEEILSEVRERQILRRAQRDQLHDMQSAARSSGASDSRTQSYFSDWLGGSADALILDELETLRDRSRELVRSDPWASGLSLIAADTSMGMGLVPRPNLPRSLLKRYGYTEKRIEEVEELASYEWEKWSKTADAQDRCSWDEMSWLSTMTSLTDGEIFWHNTHIDIANDPRREYSLVVEMLDPDRVDTPRDKEFDSKNIRSGIELGDRDQPIRYWISKEHPHEWRGDASFAREFVPINKFSPQGRQQIGHLYQTLRPGQSRGVPWLRPVIAYFADLAEYMEAEIVAARVAACFTVFIKRAPDNANRVQRQIGGVNKKGERIRKLGPGHVLEGEIGESIDLINSQRQNPDVSAFVTTILRAICTSLRIPYESIDVASANFSSARMATSQAAMAARRYRERFTTAVGQPTYAQFFEEAFLRNKLGDFDFYQDPHAWTQATWVVRGGMAHVDPEKEAKAAVIRVNNGFSTRTAEAEHYGQRFEAVVAQLAQEQKLIDRHGLKLGDPKPAPAAPPEDDEDENEDEPADSDTEDQEEDDDVGDS